MLKIKIEIQRDSEIYTNTYNTNHRVNMRMFREIWNIMKKELEDQMYPGRHYHGKDPRKKCIK